MSSGKPNKWISEPLNLKNFLGEHVPTPLLVCSTFGGITILSVRTPSKPNAMPLKTCLVKRDLNPISNLKKDNEKDDKSNNHLSALHFKRQSP